jgi:hypothetical protein
MNYVYIITEEPAFHDEPTAFTLKEARITRRKLQKVLDSPLDKDVDTPPLDVKIYKLIEVM